MKDRRDDRRFHFRLTEESLSSDRLIEAVSTPDTGAVATFAGVVRGLTHVDGSEVKTDFLVYESYAAMARKQSEDIAAKAFEKWPAVARLAVEHRIGRCGIGEVTVLTAASSPHRGDGCFEACRYVIEQLKATVPIWKQENEADSETWVVGNPDKRLDVNAQ